MSTDFRSCPSCKEMVLADTYECPKCSHIFDEKKTRQLTTATTTVAPQDLKGASLEEECRNCGAMVRVGLVRCWNCNSFMRADIARRYEQLTTAPQKIIFSDIPIEERTDFLPPRASLSPTDRPSGELSEDGFVLSGHSTNPSTSSSGDSEFTLDADLVAKAPAPAAPPTAGGPPGLTPPPSGKASAAFESVAGSSAAAADNGSAAAKQKSDDADKHSAEADDLLAIAMQEQNETGLRKKAQKKSSGPKTQIIISCPSCSNLVRTTDEYAGRRVRCPKCKKAVPIPAIKTPVRKKVATRSDKKADEPPRLNVTWMNDAWLHTFAATSVVLKPGSMKDQHQLVDIALADSGLFILQYCKENAKSSKKAAAETQDGGMLNFVRDKLLGFLRRGSADAALTADEMKSQWKIVREQVAKTGEFKDLPNADVHSVTKANLEQLKLVQPILKAHESMFAGVSVFGEGRIALFVPLKSDEGMQNVLSMPISTFRTLAECLKSRFGIDIPAAENGIPADDKAEGASCFLNQSRIESVRNVQYYQNDPGYQLELSGYRCAGCGVAISEEGRKSKKLGGSNGKGLAKAKCPKCSGKFGSETLYKIVKSPTAEITEPASSDSQSSVSRSSVTTPA